MSSEKERRQLAEYISGFALKSREIKEALLAVEREKFMPESMRQHAYADNAIPIWDSQTISQPSTIAVMLELLGAKNGMKILEVGSGGGYVLALLSKIVGGKGRVFGIEISEKLATVSKHNLESAGVKNAEVRHGDGSQGWPGKHKFDRILISCACPFIPKKLFVQLKEGGRIVAPVGDRGTQVLEIMVKQNGKPVKKSYEGGLYAFVPLRGKSGF